MKFQQTYIFSVVALTAVALFSSSCDGGVDYTPAEAPTGTQAYFPATVSSRIDLSEADTVFTIPVMRRDAEGAVTIPLDVSGDTERFSVPESLFFADGETETELTIGYNPNSFAYDEYYELTIAIPEEYATPYGISSYTFTAGIPSAWVSLGTALYTDDFITTFYGVDTYPYEVEIQENAASPGLFRLVYPYGEAYPYNEAYDDGTADWDLTRTYYLEINATDPDGVFIPQQQTGMDWGYGNIEVWSEASREMELGATLEDVKAVGLTGTYAEGIITFPPNTLLVSMPLYAEGFFTANTGGAFRVELP